MTSIQRALIRKKLASQKVHDLTPTKFAVTSFNFGEEEEDECSLVSKPLSLSVMSADDPKTPFVVKKSGNGRRVVNNTIVESRDDDETLFQLFDESLRDPPTELITAGGFRSRVERIDRHATAAPLTPLTTAGTPVYDANLFDSPVDVKVTSTPQSFLHGMVINDDEVDMDEHIMRVTPTPKTTAVKKGKKMFESSPLTQPDKSGMLQGLSFVDLNLSEHDGDQPTPLPEMRKDSSSPTMFASSPLTYHPDDSLLQKSMSSFIENDVNTLTVERELFDSTTKKMTPMKTMYDDTKSDIRESIQLTPAFSFKGSLVRAKPLLTFEEEEGDDEYDDDLEILSNLGLDDAVYHESKQKPTPIKKDDLMEASSSPTGVTGFHQDEGFTFSPPALPAASPKTNLISRLLEQAFGGCQPLDGIICRGGHCGSGESTKKQQQPAASWIPAPSTSSSIKRPGLVQRNYSPAEELSFARQNAYLIK